MTKTTDFFKLTDEQTTRLLSDRVIDNRQITMTQAINYLLGKQEVKSLDIAVGYFYLSGLLLVKDVFTDFMNQRNGHFRILMGNETNKATVKLLDTNSEGNYYQYIYNQSKSDTAQVSDQEFLAMVEEWLAQGRIEVKVYTGEANYFHAKSYLFASSQNADEGTAIVGSSNFSRNGLEGNTELNVLSKDNYLALHRWYSNLWLSEEEVQDFSPDLIKIVHSNVPDKPQGLPYKTVEETYFDFANLYAKPYTELDPKKDWVKDLYPHQRSGVVAIKDRLDTFGTAVLSDGVGLGKTRTAAGVLRKYMESETVNKVLILADSKLHTQWREEMKAVGVAPDQYTLMSRDELVRRPLKEIDRMHFTLIVVDEAHQGFKNSRTRSYRTLQRIKRKFPDTKGLMLTATPWNNRRDDVLNIGLLFMNLDGVPADRTYKQYLLLGGTTGKTVKKLAADDKAFNEFWRDLYLQRTRHTYGGQGAQFPKRNFPSIAIPYEPQKEQIFSDNFEAIANLHFPYMDPITYVDPNKDRSMAKQLKLLLLKRADSSWIAFRDSLKNIEGRLLKLKKRFEQDIMLKKGKGLLRAYQNLLGEAYDLSNYQSENLGFFVVDGQEENLDEQEQNSKLRKQQYLDHITEQIESIKVNTATKVVEEMYQDIVADLSILQRLIERLNKAYVKIDEKLDTVLKQVDYEVQQHHKVILVSQFADTVQYYYDALYAHFNGDNQGHDDQHPLNLPMGKVLGGGNNDGNRLNQDQASKQAILESFSPRSKNRLDLLGTPQEIELLVGTDTISTGQNLQDAVTLMNIDLPYNPMTLEQRIGRIDRPRKDAKTGEIYIYTFPAYRSIESQLKMTQRLGTKMEGIISDTEFDDVVLPEYQHYLQNMNKKPAKAVETMLNETDAKLTYQGGMSAEQHSEQYQEANRRMYDYRSNGFKKLAKPAVPTFSFSKVKEGSSAAVVTLHYRDVNGSELQDENVLINLTNQTTSTIIEVEKEFRAALGHSIMTTGEFDQNKALDLVSRAKDGIKQAIKAKIDQYNSQQLSMKDNMSDLADSTSSKAAANIRSSTKANPAYVANRMQECGLKPSDLKGIVSYIQTITKEDITEYAIVKEIAANVDRFWEHFDSYSELFSPDRLEVMNDLGEQRKQVDSRAADYEKSSFDILFGNLIAETEERSSSLSS